MTDLHQKYVRLTQKLKWQSSLQAKRKRALSRIGSKHGIPAASKLQSQIAHAARNLNHLAWLRDNVKAKMSEYTRRFVELHSVELKDLNRGWEIVYKVGEKYFTTHFFSGNCRILEENDFHSRAVQDYTFRKDK